MIDKPLIIFSLVYSIANQPPDQSGIYWLQLMDKYAANWSVLIIAIIECILIAWLYGSERFLGDIQHMIGTRSKAWFYFWSWMWRYVTPATLLFILFFNWVEYKPASYGTYVYPMWADGVGWLVGLFPVAVIIVTAVYEVVHGPPALTVWQRVKFLVRPTCEWRPANRAATFTTNHSPQHYDGMGTPANTTAILINGMPQRGNDGTRVTVTVESCGGGGAPDQGLQL